MPDKPRSGMRTAQARYGEVGPAPLVSSPGSHGAPERIGQIDMMHPYGQGRFVRQALVHGCPVHKCGNLCVTRALLHCPGMSPKVWRSAVRNRAIRCVRLQGRTRRGLKAGAP